MVEAFDRAEAKRMLIETWLSQRPGRPVVAASGLAGYGGNRKLHSRRMGDLYVCGDEESQCPEGVSPMAPTSRSSPTSRPTWSWRSLSGNWEES